MHPIIVDCVDRLVRVLDQKASTNGNEIEVKKMMSNLTMDVIARCAFGTQIDVYSGQRNEFLENAKKEIEGSPRLWLFNLIVLTFPKLIEWTQFRGIDPKATEFFRNAVSSMKGDFVSNCTLINW